MQPLKYSLKPGSSLDLPGSSSLEFLYKDGWGLEGVKCSVRSAIKKLPRWRSCLVYLLPLDLWLQTKINRTRRNIVSAFLCPSKPWFGFHLVCAETLSSQSQRCSEAHGGIQKFFLDVRRKTLNCRKYRESFLYQQTRRCMGLPRRFDML